MHRKDRKYMIWLDRVQPHNYCGLGETTPDRRKSPAHLNAAQWGYNPDWPDAATYFSPPAFGVTLLEKCGGGPGAPLSYYDSTEAHELTHTLGAVNEHAPHSTTHGHCWDEHDLMCYDDSPPSNDIVDTLSGTHAIVNFSNCPTDPYDDRLDCHYDDYFNSRRHLTGYLSRYWNVADNRFLIGPP
jgi:hypothetical protein